MESEVAFGPKPERSGAWPRQASSGHEASLPAGLGQQAPPAAEPAAHHRRGPPGLCLNANDKGVWSWVVTAHCTVPPFTECRVLPDASQQRTWGLCPHHTTGKQNYCKHMPPADNMHMEVGSALLCTRFPRKLTDGVQGLLFKGWGWGHCISEPREGAGLLAPGPGLGHGGL